MEKQFTREELNIIRQWFNAVKDINPKYLNETDEQLNFKILGLINQPEIKSVVISDFQNSLRKDFNVDSRVEYLNGQIPYLIIKVKECEFRIQITSDMTYISLKKDLIKEMYRNHEFASDIEFLIYSIKKSTI